MIWPAGKRLPVDMSGNMSKIHTGLLTVLVDLLRKTKARRNWWAAVKDHRPSQSFLLFELGQRGYDSNAK